LILNVIFVGECLVCGCTWDQHQHITYEYETNLTHLDENCSLEDIDKRITDLRNEKLEIEDVYKKLSKFLHANAILPLNDEILEYLKHFIQEEQMKTNCGEQNNEIIKGLEQMIDDYKQEMELFKETIKNEIDPINSIDVLKSEDIFTLVGKLYRLPINGKAIREQVDGLRLTQENIERKRENYVKLPIKANDSNVMRQFKAFLPLKK
jgi:hypothetical protein